MLEQLAEKLADTSTTAGDKEGGDKLPEEASSSKDGDKDGGKYGEKGGGKDGQPVQKRGGWLPKMVKLVRAIKSEQWWEVGKLTDEYLKNWSLKELVDEGDI